MGYWGKEGPELVAERARAFGDPDQTLAFGANTYRLMERFHTESSDPVRRRDVVPRLKAESPVPLRCHGSISMNRALLGAGLVDRLELTVFPVITGESGSNPVLAGLPDIDLELVDSRTFDGRVQQLSYVPRGLWRH